MRLADRPAGTRTGPVLNLDLAPFAFWGLALVLFASPFLRGLFFEPDLYPVLMVVAAVFALAWYDQVLRREVRFLTRPLDLFTLAFAGAYLLSTLVAVNRHEAALGFLKAAGYFMVYWSASRLARDYRRLRRLLQALFAAGAGVAVVGVAAAAGIFKFPGAMQGGVVMSTLQYENALAIYLVMTNTIGLALGSSPGRPWGQGLYIAGSYLITVVILLTQSRGGWVIYPLSLGALAALVPPRYRAGVAYGAVLTLSVALLAARSFLPRLEGGGGWRSLLPLLVGVAVTLAGQAAYHLALALLDRFRVSRRARSWLLAGGAVYLGLILIFYILHVSPAVPEVAARFVPREVLVTSRKIKADEPSLVGRIFASRDALKMVRDYPLLGAGAGGWNALYHRYQSSLYWTTEVHNHFAQVWVETGTAGILAYLAIWGSFLHTLYRLWYSRLPEAHRALAWGAAVAAVALGAHSFLDFDLSLPAVAMTLWALFGLTRAVVSFRRAPGGEDSYPGGGRTGAYGHGPAPAPGQEASRGAGTWGLALRSPAARGTAAPGTTPARLPGTGLLLATALAATLGAAVIFVPAAAFNAAGKAGAEGARAMLARDLARAEEAYLRATRLDPFSGSFAADLAQVYTAIGAWTGDRSYTEKAERYAQMAVRAEPYNPKVRSALAAVYLIQDRMADSVAQAEALVEINPLDVTAYEALGRAYILAARYHLGRTEPSPARAYADKALALPGRMEDKKTSLNPRATRFWGGPRLEVTPGLSLVLGQARYLRGDYTGALDLLRKGPASGPYRQEATLWLAAALERAGKGDEAARLKDKLFQENPALGEEYGRITGLPAVPPG